MFNLPIIPPLGESILFTLDIPNTSPTRSRLSHQTVSALLNGPQPRPRGFRAGPFTEHTVMTDAPSAAPGIPMWLYHLKGAIHQNISKPYKKNFDATTNRQLPNLVSSKADLRLLQMSLLHALFTGPHFPVKHLNHLQSQTWYAANTIITFIYQPSEGKKLATNAHALMAAHHAAECATGKNDDAIVAAFTSVAAAVTAANQDVTAFWDRAAEVLVNQLKAAIIQGLTNSH